MHLREFMAMVREEAKKNGGNKEHAPSDGDHGVTGKYETGFAYMERTGGIQCSVCLKEDGAVSEATTAIALQFVITPEG